MDEEPTERPASPWPHPSDLLQDLDQVVRFRVGTHAAGLTIWLERRDGTEHFMGSLNDPEAAKFACDAMNWWLARRQRTNP